jgi:hypothetical protein
MLKLHYANFHLVKISCSFRNKDQYEHITQPIKNIIDNPKVSNVFMVLYFLFSSGYAIAAADNDPEHKKNILANNNIIHSFEKFILTILNYNILFILQLVNV